MKVSPKDSYGTAELRLRELLFGDGMYSAGFVRGDEQRQRVRAELHRMREAFDEIVRESESADLDLAEDLLGAVPESRQSEPRTGD